MQRLLDFLATATNAVLAKLKRLAIHIIKHPLGSMWWAVKMYFALMFFSLFVACSFGAFASAPTAGTCKIGTPLDGVGCTTTAPIKLRYTFNWAGFSGSGTSANDAYSKLTSAWSSSGGQCMSGKGSVSKKVLETYPPIEPSPPKSISVGFKGETTCTYTTIDPVTEQPVTNRSVTSALFTGISLTSGQGAVCPPEGVYEDFKLLHMTGTNTGLCYKAFDPPACFTDPKYNISSQFHFSKTDAGKGGVCVLVDNGLLCPFKELSGGNGVFAPDIDNKELCSTPPSTPTPPPVSPEVCHKTGSGFKACNADPNEKCTAQPSGQMSCPASCGYLNGVFMCFTEQDPTPDPNKPDPLPRPDKNDQIDDPQKAISDMVKGDFKQIQRGVESRLDGFTVDMQNLLKSQDYAIDQANKNSAQGNKLLNSINQNTADTVKELKKINEGTVAGSIEKPEFGEKNDWNQRNFGTVLKGKVDELGNLPIIKSATAFFDVSFAGSCPVYNVSVWVFEIQIDQFCTAEMQAIFPYIKAVVLLIAAFLAFRVAFL
jgi:hypothetical protein